MKDIRDLIFRNIGNQRVTAVIIADDEGILSGTTQARVRASELGLTMIHMNEEGEPVRPGTEIAGNRRTC